MRQAVGFSVVELPAPQSDVDRALTMFAALNLGETSDSLHMITIPGAPWSKSRPRFARSGHAYPKAEDVDAEKRTGLYLRRTIRKPFPGNVAIGCVFFRPNRQRIDADNLIKHVCDAANGILWADDSQCTAVMGIVELDPENPRTVVVVGEHVSTMLRGSNATWPCAVCARPVPMAGDFGRRKTCSRACAARIKGNRSLDTPIACQQCGTPFRRTTSYQKLCSSQCRADSLRDRRRARRSPLSNCSECGVQLTHHRGGRCRACWRANPKANVHPGGVA